MAGQFHDSSQTTTPLDGPTFMQVIAHRDYAGQTIIERMLTNGILVVLSDNGGTGHDGFILKE